MIKITLLALGLLGATALPLQSAVADTVPTAPAAAPQSVAVTADGLVATWYPPASGKRGPAVLALGGSEGGTAGGQYLGKAVAAQGYGVLSLAYFGADGLPKTLQEIPLEYFDRALSWLAKQPLVDAKRIGIYGISVGGETALLVASRHPEVKAVIAAVPSSVVWQGLNPANYGEVKSSYSLGGRPVAFVAYDNSAAFTGILDLYQRSLARAEKPADATIPVERIGGAVLLLSAKDDKLWPSTAMSDAVIARLDSHGFKPLHQHIGYPDAGHGAMSPPSGDPRMRARDNLGGTPEGNQAARIDMWGRVTAFLAQTLGAPKS